MKRTVWIAAITLAAAAALGAGPSLAADANTPMPGKDTGTPRASQPAAAGPGQSRSSDESPQSTDKSASQGAKGSAKAAKAKKKRSRASKAAATGESSK